MTVTYKMYKSLANFSFCNLVKSNMAEKRQWSFIFEAYHSKFTNVSNQVGNMAVLPLRTNFKGPAPKSSKYF